MNKRIAGPSGRTWLLPLLVLPWLLACERQGPLVARAEGNELAVSEVVAMLAAEQFPNQPEVVATLAELWVDYTLLAQAAAEDTAFAQLDVGPMIRQQLEQEMILALRDSVVQPDTAIAEDELNRRFAQEAPGTRVRARHILLAFPDQANDAQRAEVRQRAEEIRAQAMAGESFEALARQHSQDRASAAEGGDLGFFGKDEMVRPFEDAAFALQPGEISEVVESPYGLHIIRVEEKEVPDAAEIMPTFRERILQERFQSAESTFVAGIEQQAAIEIEEGSATLVKSLAESPANELSGRARDRALVSFQGGSITVGEVQDFMQTRAPQFRQQLYQAPDEVVEENFLRGLAQRELLVMEAERRGLQYSQPRADSLSGQLKASLRDATRTLGLMDVQPQEGESQTEAHLRVVELVLRDMVQGTRDVLPLGAFSFVLREHYSSQVYPTGVERVVQQIDELRGPETPSAPAPGPGAGPAPEGQPALPPGDSGQPPAGAEGGAPPPPGGE